MPEILDLSVNKFVGTLDPRIVRFQNLTHLIIENNDFSGILPSTIEQLTNLEVFKMGINPALGGPALSYSTQWSNLMDLDISQTLASGTIPTELGLLTKLTSIGFWDAPLSGTIPSEIGNLEVLGKEPTTTMLTCCSGMNELASHNNTLYCTNLTNDFPLCRTTAEIGMGMGKLGGSLPTEIGLLTNMKYFGLFETSFTGTIPSEIGAWTSL